MKANLTLYQLDILMTHSDLALDTFMFHFVTAQPAAWRLWYCCYLHEIDRNWETGNSAVSILFHWHCEICLRLFDKTCSKSFNISGNATPCVYTGLGHLAKSIGSKVHIRVWVITKVHTFEIHFAHPILGQQMAGASQITVITSCALSIQL